MPYQASNDADRRYASNDRGQGRARGKKKPRVQRGLHAGSGLQNNSRRRPTLPQSFPCSTIGPEGLNFRVRDGIGCGPSGKTAGTFCRPTTMTANFQKLFGVLSAIKRLDLINGVSRTKKIMVIKPHDRLVLVSSAPCSASTPSLSTSSSTRGL